MDNLNEQNEQMNFMPVNGQSFIPDGKMSGIPGPVVKANNMLKAQVPVSAAAMAGATPQMAGMGSVSPEDTEEDEESVEEMEESANEQFRMALTSLLGENISSEAIAQLEGIFEAAVNDKVNNTVNVVVNKLDENVQNYLENVTNTLVEKVDDYLDYVVEEWMQENNVAVEQGIKTQIAENFITGLKNLFENHYIDVPNDKYNALDELYSQNRELEHNLNYAINENMNIRKDLMLNECATIFVAQTRDLADTQIAKLQSLMENVSFASVDEYQHKLNAIKNNYLTSQQVIPAPVQRPLPQPINEEMTFSPIKNIENTSIDGYANAIGRLNKKL
jgi:hypothetical protein